MIGYGGMMGYGFGGMGYGLGFIWQIVWLVIIVAVIYFIVNSLSSNRNTTSGEESRALRILDERFARGEIDAEEYRKMRKELES